MLKYFKVGSKYKLRNFEELKNDERVYDDGSGTLDIEGNMVLYTYDIYKNLKDSQFIADNNQYILSSYDVLIAPWMCKEVESESKVYIGGDMLYKGSQLLRVKEREDIKALGYEIYNPMDNKDINNKSEQGNAKDLPDRIVAQDTKALIESEIITLDCQRFSEGTLVELGQLKGMRDLIYMIIDLNQECETNSEFVSKLQELSDSILCKRIYPHCEDIRRHDEPEIGDNRSFYINAYVKGVCNDLTEGKGLYEWDDIIKELKKNAK